MGERQRKRDPLQVKIVQDSARSLPQHSLIRYAPHRGDTVAGLRATSFAEDCIREFRKTSMGLVHNSCWGSNLVFTNRIQLGRSIAVCLIALGYGVTSLADTTATMARPGSLSQGRLNSAAQHN